METTRNSAEQDSFWEDLLNQMNEELRSIEREQPKTAISHARASLEVCKKTAARMRAHVMQRGFSNRAEEIFFFREIKPKCYGRLIFYYKVYSVELGRPAADLAHQRDYLQKEFADVKTFYNDHKFWYQYLRSGETYLDEKLFVRNDQIVPIMCDTCDVNSDPSFSTGYDHIFARIFANDLLLAYLQKAVSTLSEQNDNASNLPSMPKALTWTDSKVGLVEMCYSFKVKGTFDNGKATLKEISDYLQYVFDVELTNPSRDFQEILRRKSGYANYIDSLKDSYLKYIDDIENRDRR